MRIVLENLIDNAWKFSAKKEDACIEFGCRDEDPPVFFVRDNGAGFERQNAGGLFDVFRRGQGEGEVDGYGIGLATACKIIQRHGGRIWADGEAGIGATFYFTL
jgi:light-regulated signal transduction histidine kinase (bacteriophytochrome)